MSASPWKKYSRLQELVERYGIPIDELLHLASQGQLTLYGCLPSGVLLRKGPGGELISAPFVRLNQDDVQELELHDKVTLSQFDTAVSVIDGACIEHDSIGRRQDGLVNSLFNRFCTKDGKPVTFERNDIFLIHNRNMKAILRDDLWRSSVLDIDAPPECADAAATLSEGDDIGLGGAGAQDVVATSKEGVAKKEVMSVDWPLIVKYDMNSLASALADVRRGWLQLARVGRPGAAGKESHRWNPAMLAFCLYNKGWIVSKAKLQQVLEKHFTEYLPEWEELKEQLS